MVSHWRTVRESGWLWRLGDQRASARVLTAVVLVVVVSVKFVDGAYLVVILIPILVAMMLFIHRQYDASRRELAVRRDFVFEPPAPRGAGRRARSRASTGRSSRRSTSAARSPTTSGRSSSPRTPRTAPAIRERWERQLPGVPLVVVESPYRALTGPLEAYLDVLDAAWPPDKPAPITFVVLPEYVARRWWERILYNQSVKRLRSSLLGRPHTVVVNVPYRREDPTLFERRRIGAERRRPAGSRPARPPRPADRCGPPAAPGAPRRAARSA